jgi:urea transporter
MIAEKLKYIFPYFWQSLSNSYTQIFFSKNKVLGLLLILVSMFDLNAGFAGLLAVLTANMAAYLSGLNRNKVVDGLYGFNALLAGLGLGIHFQFNMVFVVVLIFISLLSLLITGMLEGILTKYGLPFLSLPFLFATWIAMLSTRQFGHLEISQRGIYTLNEMYLLGGLSLVKVYDWFNTLGWPEMIKVYFRSLGAIFFQYHLFAGLVIAAGLVYWSRLAFLFSVIGFAAAWLFYDFIGASISELSYTYIGFNYILTAIAIGGFFVIPSASSFLYVLLSVPLIAFLIVSGNVVLGTYQLGIFSLPFNIVVILLVYLFYLRERFHEKPTLVYIQQYSPEKNLYSYLVNKIRLSHLGKIPMKLPFWGKWIVTQGIEGEHTHKDVWKYAWDFEMSDEEGKTYSGNGHQLTDYYCYNKPVVAPADGYITAIVDGVDDNLIGDFNLKDNWGNSIVVSHATGLFSQLSHLRKNSIIVKTGQYVRKGEQLASCGNSGRSPYPHLHFQFQAAGEVGAATLNYPFAAYLHHGKETAFRSSSQPVKAETVSNNQILELLDNALHFIPGQILFFKADDGEKTRDISWKIETDIYNNTFIRCEQTGAKAWFVRQPDIFFFTHYEGDKNSLLFDFFLGTYQLITGFVPGLQIKEQLTLSLYPNRFVLALQDFIAPFYRFLSATYTLEQKRLVNDLSSPRIAMQSRIRFCIFGRKIEERSYEMSFSENQLMSYTVNKSNKKIKLSRE